jgi:hypothetical protein
VKVHRLPRGKVLIQAYVKREIAERLRELAKMKHEHLRGAISEEVEAALQAWLAAHTNAHKPEGGRYYPAPMNPPLRVARAWEAVKEYLRQAFGYVVLDAGAQVLRSHLVQAVAATRGSDRRTVEKYLGLFRTFKLLKHVGGEVYEVV